MGEAGRGVKTITAFLAFSAEERGGSQKTAYIAISSGEEESVKRGQGREGVTNVTRNSGKNPKGERGKRRFASERGGKKGAGGQP